MLWVNLLCLLEEGNLIILGVKLVFFPLSGYGAVQGWGSQAVRGYT
jgi:hypothetical protein